MISRTKDLHWISPLFLLVGHLQSPDDRSSIKMFSIEWCPVNILKRKIGNHIHKIPICIFFGNNPAHTAGHNYGLWGSKTWTQSDSQNGVACRFFRWRNRVYVLSSNLETWRVTACYSTGGATLRQNIKEILFIFI